MHRAGLPEDKEGVYSAMSDVDIERIERLAAALVKKLGNLHHSYPPQELDNAIVCMIQTAVADTYMVMTGRLSVEDYECE